MGVVVIGRNEGPRLRQCIESVRSVADLLVYVDSGSTDGSVETAHELGAVTVELDLRTPFTAARARNAGFAQLDELNAQLEYVFFVDGDCEVAQDWLPTARAFLEARRDVAVVWGRRRERYPERSVYNRLCDIEWSAYPIGETKFCGGDALMRAGPFRKVRGYRADMICGEEPELCIRLRRNGWKIWHLDVDMTLHDAAMHHFHQWWRRMLRGGYAYALGASLHGAPPERHWVAESRRVWVWGLFIPIAVLILTVSVSFWALLLWLVYPIQWLRLARRARTFTAINWSWATAMIVGKFPEMLGQLKFVIDQVAGVNSGLIEYK
jgi:glycosyltransferase involved in cell wall biosynthesis